MGEIIMKNNTRMMVWAAMFSALSVVAAMISRFVPTEIIPFSLMPFVVLLAGALLGPRWGMMSMLVYALLGLVGIPVFASPHFGGPAYLIKPTFGFIIGYIVAPLAMGLIIKNVKSGIVNYIIASLVGLIVIYAFGLPYFYVIMKYVLASPMSVAKLIAKVMVPFIMLDIIKALAAAFLAKLIGERI